MRKSSTPPLELFTLICPVKSDQFGTTSPRTKLTLKFNVPAPLNVLLLDPRLPPWLPEITLRNLRVGSATVTLRFSRDGDRSDYEVLDQRGRLHVIRQPSPWSLTAGFAERLRDVLSSLLPGI